MINLIEHLPVDLVGNNVLAYLSLKDIVMLERGCCSKKTHQQLCGCVPYCPPVRLPSYTEIFIPVFNWFCTRRCRISSVDVFFPGNNLDLDVKMERCNLMCILCEHRVENSPHIQETDIGSRVRSITVNSKQNKDVMEQLSACTRNVKKLTIKYSDCKDWLTADILRNWNLQEIYFFGFEITLQFLMLLVQTCTELTNITLYSNSINDTAVIAIAQHCPKLEKLLLSSNNITWTSLLTLSERGLPLKVLDIDYVPHIPTADIARRCSHALSCISHLNTDKLHRNGQDANILIPYMTGLYIVHLDFYCPSYIPLLTDHCHKLTKIVVHDRHYSVSDILSLCCTNIQLQSLYLYSCCGFTDTALIELLHACPHIHTLYFSNFCNITDIGILALSEHCPQLQELDIVNCSQVSEAAALQLLQRCHKLTILVVSSSSLSEETWTQLDSNTQKRVIRG